MSINFFITIFVCIIYNEFIFNLKLHCDTMIEIYVLLMYLEGNIWKQNGIQIFGSLL